MHVLVALALPALAAFPPQQREHHLAVYGVEDVLGQGGWFPRASPLGDPRPPRRWRAAAPTVPAGSLPPPPRDPARQAERELARQEEHLQATSALADLLRDFVDPPLDPQRDELRVLAPGTLALVGSAPQHAWLERFLEVQRTHGGMVEIQAEFVELPARALDGLGFRHGDVLRTLQARDAALERLKAAPGSEDLQSPVVVALPRSVVTIEVADEVLYVKDWELRVVEPGARELADPLVEALDEGLRLETNAALLEHGLWGLKLRATHAKLRRPIGTAEIELGGRSLEVARPEICKVDVDAALALEDGASAVLAVPHADGERVLVVVVSVRKSPAQGAGAPR